MAVFSDVKHIILSKLKLVDKVHRLAVSMCSYWVTGVSTKTGDRLRGMMNGTISTPESISGLGAGVGGKTMGTEIPINNDLVEVGGVFGK